MLAWERRICRAKRLWRARFGTSWLVALTALTAYAWMVVDQARSSATAVGANGAAVAASVSPGEIPGAGASSLDDTRELGTYGSFLPQALRPPFALENLPGSRPR